MAISFTCVPSAVTVYPCPTGTAPQSTVVTTPNGTVRDFYPGKFDGLPVQDVVVAAVLVALFVGGFVAGKRP